jgi:pilus assembly protein Flp/PilA
MFGRFLRDETATTAIEYGLIAALIAIAIIGGATKVGSALNDLWGSNTSQIQQALKPTPSPSP